MYKKILWGHAQCLGVIILWSCAQISTIEAVWGLKRSSVLQLFWSRVKSMSSFECKANPGSKASQIRIWKHLEPGFPTKWNPGSTESKFFSRYCPCMTLICSKRTQWDQLHANIHILNRIPNQLHPKQSPIYFATSTVLPTNNSSSPTTFDFYSQY